MFLNVTNIETGSYCSINADLIKSIRVNIENYRLTEDNMIDFIDYKLVFVADNKEYSSEGCCGVDLPQVLAKQRIRDLSVILTALVTTKINENTYILVEELERDFEKVIDEDSVELRSLINLLGY